jgi:hypothetical protein
MPGAIFLELQERGVPSPVVLTEWQQHYLSPTSTPGGPKSPLKGFGSDINIPTCKIRDGVERV